MTPKTTLKAVLAPAWLAVTTLLSGIAIDQGSGHTAMGVEPRITAARKIQMPEYVTTEEVQRVCRELRIRDWTQLSPGDISEPEAIAILSQLETEGMVVDVEDFLSGLKVELEHGQKFKTTDVTKNHPILTGKIVLAHLKEFADYYQRLEVLEIEGDLFKAVLADESEKIIALQRKLMHAKLELRQAEAEAISEK